MSVTPAGLNPRGKGLGVLNLMSQLKRTDVVAFCMQLGNSEDR